MKNEAPVDPVGLSGSLSVEKKKALESRMVTKAPSIDSRTAATAALKSTAERIAALLFTNGFNQVAERLVLTVDGPPKRDLGGWCKGTVVDLVADVLVEAFSSNSPPYGFATSLSGSSPAQTQEQTTP